MKKKIDSAFSWFNGLSTFVKIVSSFIVVVTWGASLVTIYNNHIVHKYESKIKIDLKQVNEKLEVITLKAVNTDSAIKIINDNQIIISNQVDSVSGQVKGMSDQFGVLNRKFDTQTRAIGNHFQKENMLQDKIDFLQELIDDEKKNSRPTRSGAV